MSSEVTTSNLNFIYSKIKKENNNILECINELNNKGELSPNVFSELNKVVSDLYLSDIVSFFEKNKLTRIQSSVHELFLQSEYNSLVLGINVLWKNKELPILYQDDFCILYVFEKLSMLENIQN